MYSFSSFFVRLSVLLEILHRNLGSNLVLLLLFPFFYLFSLDIIIFYICHTYFSILVVILCSFLLPDIWIQIFQTFKHFLLAKHQKHTIGETTRDFLLASEAFQRTRVLRDLGSRGILTRLGESVSDCHACRVHTEPAHPMTLDPGCLVQ